MVTSGGGDGHRAAMLLPLDPMRENAKMGGFTGGSRQRGWLGRELLVVMN